MWWSHGDWGWGAWIVMSLGMVAFWFLVIWLFLNVARTERTAVPRDPTPEEILGERRARGDIDAEEYRRRLETLHPSRGADATRSAATR